MSDLFALAGRREGGGFSRDPRFVSASAAMTHGTAAEAVDPIATAFAEGFAAGSNEALEAAEAAAFQAAQAREKLNASFVRLDAELAEMLRHKLIETVTALCESVLHPLALDAQALARRVETAAAMFVRADDERVVRLHPDDLDLIAGQLPADWQFKADASLERGALRVETASGGVEDGPAQWRAAITEALRLC
jgi:flagellar assembly protein FliH